MDDGKGPAARKGVASTSAPEKCVQCLGATYFTSAMALKGRKPVRGRRAPVAL